VFEQTFKNIDDVLHKDAGCTSELDYTEQSSWLLFLKYLDALEEEKAAEATLERKRYTYIIDKPYRWDTWAAPKTKGGKIDHNKALTGDDLIRFVNRKLFPYLAGFKQRAESSETIEYKIGEVFGEIKNKLQSGYSLRDAIDLIDQLRFRSQTEKHELSHLYEAKIKNMGNAGRNGGEYYTPRPLIRAMIQVVDPKIGERIYDGACGSAGFLCEAFDYLSNKPGLTTRGMQTLQKKTFYGKEKKSLAYVIGIMNMILHGIEAPNIVHTNTLGENIQDIQQRDRFDVILANPPFGGKERPEVQQNFPIKSAETAYLFLQHFLKSLKAGGRAAIVIKNTFLSNNDNAACSLRKLLLETCNLHTILEIPSGAFQGASVNTVVLFFEKGPPTRQVWFYQLNPGRSLGKTNALNDSDLNDFLEKQKGVVDSQQSWSVSVNGIDKNTYDLSFKNLGTDRKVRSVPASQILKEIKKIKDQELGLVFDSAFFSKFKKWPNLTIGESCNIVSGGTPSKSNDLFWAGDIPWVSAKDLKSDRIFDAEMHVSKEAIENSATKIAPAGSLLILVRGMGLANGIPIGEVVSPVAFNQDIRAIIPPEYIFPRYLLLALRGIFSLDSGKSILSTAAHGTLKIDADNLGMISFPVPHIDEQRSIVAVLDTALEEINFAKRNAACKLAALEELKKSILHQAFTGQL